jgi:hypothetical protein
MTPSGEGVLLEGTTPPRFVKTRVKVPGAGHTEILVPIGSLDHLREVRVKIAAGVAKEEVSVKNDGTWLKKTPSGEEILMVGMTPKALVDRYFDAIDREREGLTDSDCANLLIGVGIACARRAGMTKEALLRAIDRTWDGLPP